MKLGSGQVQAAGCCDTGRLPPFCAFARGLREEESRPPAALALSLCSPRGGTMAHGDAALTTHAARTTSTLGLPFTHI